MTPIEQGPFIFVTKQGLVFGATSVEPNANNITVRLKGLQHTINLDDIEVIYAVDASHPSATIDPGILSTITAFERLLIEYAQGKKAPKVTIFGSGSLALTLVPDRSTNDIDALVSDDFAEFVNSKNTETDIDIELLDEQLLKLLGPWQERTSELHGPLGAVFHLVHPLDTVMQKLLRFTEERFVEKDQGDIEAVLAKLQPSKQTLVTLLTENPARYARLPGRFSSAVQAVERNTRWFLSHYVPDHSYEDILQITGDRALEPARKAGFLPQIESVDLKKLIRPQKNNPTR